MEQLDAKTFLTIEDLRLFPAPEVGQRTFILYGHPFFLQDSGDPHDNPNHSTAIAPVGWFDTTLDDPAKRQNHDPNNLIFHLPPGAAKLDDDVIGMSGCGIWCVRYDRDGLTPRNQDGSRL